MPLIPNYIARLRTHSHSTAVTSSSQSGSRSNSTADPPTPGLEFTHLASDAPAISQSGNTASPSPQVQIARKIHPDLGALLDEHTVADNVVRPVGPPPPKRRSRSTGQLVSRPPEDNTLREAEDEDVRRTDIPSPAADGLETSASPRSPFLSRILSTPILSGARSTPASSMNVDLESGIAALGTRWSTFGRRRVLASQVGEFGSLNRRSSGSKSSEQSKSSRGQTQRISAPVTPSTTRAPSRVRTVASTSDTPPSHPDSPAGTVSSSSGSKSYSVHSQSVRSKRHPQTYPEPIPDIESSSAKDPQTPAHVSSPDMSVSPFASVQSPKPTGAHLDDSPQTFGRSTPKHPGLTQNTLPELGDTFRPRLTSTPPPPERYSQRVVREPSWTYPTRSRRRASRSSTVSFPSLPARPSSQSRPRAEDVFQDGKRDRKPSTVGALLGLESFLSRGGSDVGRRSSADWSAAEAGKNGNNNEGETWPAAVSREIVMLALGEGSHARPGSAGSGGIVTEAGESGAAREGSTKKTTFLGSTGEERRQFFRAARKWIAPGSSIAIDASSLSPRQSSAQPPVVTVSPSSIPTVFSSDSPTRSGQGTHSHGLVPFVSVTGPTPSASPRESQIPAAADEGSSGSGGDAHDNPSMSQGKRKKELESEDEAPPNEPTTRSILLRRRENSTRTSDASHAPSSFRHAKRIRLSTPPHSPPHDSLPSPHHSRPGSPGSRPPSSLRTLPPDPRSLSQTSIPLRAIVSPKPPSIDQNSTYHMRDPALPPPRRLSTQWTGGARMDEEIGRAFPLQGWAFIIGFLVFPLWWVAAAAPVGWGWTRHGVRDKNGKGMWSEEELAAREVIEHDVAYTWRRRCRFMSLLGLLVYIPLIVLLAVLIPRT